MPPENTHSPGAEAMPPGAAQDESPLTAAAHTAATDALTTLKEDGLNPARVVNALHTAAAEYTAEVAQGSEADSEFTLALAAELRRFAASICRHDLTIGVWTGDRFTASTMCDATPSAAAAVPTSTATPSPAPPQRNRPNMGQYLRKPLFPPGYRTQ